MIDPGGDIEHCKWNAKTNNRFIASNLKNIPSISLFAPTMCGHIVFEIISHLQFIASNTRWLDSGLKRATLV